jgi:hypothetical protein
MRRTNENSVKIRNDLHRQILSVLLQHTCASGGTLFVPYTIHSYHKITLSATTVVVTKKDELMTFKSKKIHLFLMMLLVVEYAWSSSSSLSWSNHSHNMLVLLLLFVTQSIRLDKLFLVWPFPKPIDTATLGTIILGPSCPFFQILIRELKIEV